MRKFKTGTPFQVTVKWVWVWVCLDSERYCKWLHHGRETFGATRPRLKIWRYWLFLEISLVVNPFLLRVPTQLHLKLKEDYQKVVNEIFGCTEDTKLTTISHEHIFAVVQKKQVGKLRCDVGWSDNVVKSKEKRFGLTN